MLFSNKDIRRIIIPIMLESLLAVAVGMADTLMVSSAGEVAVAAVSLVDSINVMLILIFSALASGGTVVVSQYLGKGDRDMANYSAKQLVLVIFLVSLGIAFMTALLRKILLYLIYGHIEETIIEQAAVYFLLSALSYPFLALFNSSSAIFRSIGRSANSLYCGVAMNIVNVILNYVLIFILRLGVLGAGTATLIGRATACIISLIMLGNEENTVYLRDYIHWNFDKDIISRLLQIAVPSGLENGAFQFGKLLLTRLISSFGTVSMAAYAIANSYSQFQAIPANAIGVGGLTVIGHCVGAGEYDQAKHYVRRLTLYSYLVVWILGAILLVVMGPLLPLYKISDESLALARTCALVHISGSFAFHPLAYCFPNFLRAAGDARYTMIASALSMFILRVGMSYVLAAFIPSALCVFIANFFDWIGRGVLFLLRYKSGKWMDKRLV